MPGEWHRLSRNGQRIGRYQIEVQRGWIAQVAPYLKALFTIIKLATPFDGDFLEGNVEIDEWGQHIDLMESYVNSLESLPVGEAYDRNRRSGSLAPNQQAQGAALRQIRVLLDKLDPAQRWGGLQKVLTPEGHYLWLCEHHAREYLR